MSLFPDFDLPVDVLEALLADVRRLPLKAFENLRNGKKDWAPGFRLIEKNLPIFQKRLAGRITGPAPLSDAELACLREKGLNMDCVCVFSVAALTKGFDALAGFLGGARLLAAMLIDERLPVRDYAISVINEHRDLPLPPGDPDEARKSLFPKFSPFFDLLSSVLLPPVVQKVVRASGSDTRVRDKAERSAKKVKRLEAALRDAKDEIDSYRVSAKTSAAAQAATKVRIQQLERELSSLEDRFESARRKAEKQIASAEKACREAEDRSAIAERARSEAEARATFAAAAQSEAENRAALAERARSEAEARAALAEKARSEAEARAALAEKARSEAEARAALAEKAQSEAEARAALAERARSEAEARVALAEAAQSEAATAAVADAAGASKPDATGAEVDPDNVNPRIGSTKDSPRSVIDDPNAKFKDELIEPRPPLVSDGKLTPTVSNLDPAHAEMAALLEEYLPKSVVEKSGPAAVLSQRLGLSYRRDDQIVFLLDGHNIMNLCWREFSIQRSNGMSHLEVRNGVVRQCKRLVLGFPNSFTKLFFDGDRPGRGFSSKHLVVEYSGNPEKETKHRADRAILRYIGFLHGEKRVPPENVIVVSSDQDLCHEAGLTGAMAINHDEFLAILEECK